MRKSAKNVKGSLNFWDGSLNRGLVLAGLIVTLAGLGACAPGGDTAQPEAAAAPPVEITGVYGGVPGSVESGESKPLSDFGVDAVFLNSRSITADIVENVHSQGAGIYAEFNTVHQAAYLEEHPDASPIGKDGLVSPPASGWQGICPTHPAYRKERMEEFRQLLREFALDGVWLDYHQAHANWELAEPVLPDTCFCDRCRETFSADTGIELPGGTTEEAAGFILEKHADAWISWRNGVYTDWIREFRQILDEERPEALLGYYHCPWTDQEFDGALLNKLAIDLRAQAEYIDVFSPLLYHAYLGKNGELEWISSHVTWLGEYLGIKGESGDTSRIWPIVQLADLGGDIPADQVPLILESGLAEPASGVMIFSWGRISGQAEKVAELSKFYRRLKE